MRITNKTGIKLKLVVAYFYQKQWCLRYVNLQWPEILINFMLQIQEKLYGIKRSFLSHGQLQEDSNLSEDV